MLSMTRVADRVDVSLSARINVDGPRVLSIDLPWKEGEQAMVLLSMTSSTGLLCTGPCACAILIRLRPNELATFADPSKQSEAGWLHVVTFSSSICPNYQQC